MVFSIPSYLCVGDRRVHVVDERAKGPSMYVTRPKTGHNPDALFTKPHPYIWNGERGGDSGAIQRREAAASAKKFLTPNGFTCVGPPQKPEGLGSYYGTIGGTIPYIPRHREFRGIPPKKEIAPRGIYTNRPKKGSYGYANLGLSDVGCNYVASFYNQQRDNARKEREEMKKKMAETPFKPVGRRGFTFDESVPTGVSKVYTMTKPFREKKEVIPYQHFRVEQPWRPAGYLDDKPTKMVYQEDPYGGYDPRIPRKERVKKPSDQVFYPSGCSDTFWYTQSIALRR